MTSIAQANHLATHPGVARVQRAVELVRHLYQDWQEARRHEASAQAQHEAALQEARTMAALARAMNGIAVDDIRRYCD